MRASFLIAAVSVAALSVAAVAVPPSQSFGNLQYPANSGTQISWTWPISGLSDNSNFVFTNNNIGSGGTDKWLTIGLRAHAYYGSPNLNPTYVGNSTFEVDAGGSLWQPASGDGDGDDVPPNFSNAPRWGFSWNISVDGSRDSSDLSGLFWSMRIVGPGSTGNWGTTAAGAPIGANDALNAWQLGYDFLALNSASMPGVGIPGLWDGLNFSPSTLGNYQFQIAVRQSQYGAIVGTTTMTVSVVPAPGAIALLGVAGLAGRRRRN